MLLADGFEGAFIGVSTRCGQPTLAVYDANKCLQILIDRDDMTHDEALEYFNFNVIGAWVGDETPLFLESMSLIEACNLDGGVNDNE
tara:strand:+ start:1338 stop:1598 length:261 start_codon:yes stop_codon:yes gene_type:complete